MKKMKHSKATAVVLGILAPAALLPVVAHTASAAEPGTYTVDATPNPLTSTASCRPGDTVVGGGERSRELIAGEKSGPVGSPATGWRVELAYGTSQAYVICEDDQVNSYIRSATVPIPLLDLRCDDGPGGTDTLTAVTINGETVSRGLSLLQFGLPLGTQLIQDSGRAIGFREVVFVFNLADDVSIVCNDDR